MEVKSPQTCPYSVTVRRNPHRKARPTTNSTKCHQNPIIPSSSTALEVSSFPIEEILAMEVPKNSNPNPSPNSESASENLKVFLRIRPILSKDINSKQRAKNAWPQNPAKKKSAREGNVSKKNSLNVCITANDSHSVTLSPPLSLQESKRIKSEVYEGFSHVFAIDSSQEQVFEKMVCPLVDDFLKGKSGMLAALGPSGSGKTHTVFGSPRDPGVVPRTLQRIFEPNFSDASESRRSFGISIFEIHSERGKGEKLYDLSSGGTELSLQQSTIRGLQEVIVSDATEAESLIAQALLRRLTASTNSNSQSSRSQCIINIRGVANNSEGEYDSQANNAVLSIVDLAGAEREKKTGNQGARLLESNFINNTSMVFGLCLRSLLEHQKNPKKPLQKHFQNSLLTRYLRDYLEGKRRMTLILTVKSEEVDYLDTAYLLRQASPFMSIRFTTAEEQSTIPGNKRQSQVLSRKEKPKRMKLSGSTCEIAERKISGNKLCSPVQGVSKGETKVLKLGFPNSTPSKLNDADLAKSKRSYQILQNFAKALWSVLKQHGKQLKVAEDEIQRLAENLKLEKRRNMELEKKLEVLKLSCTCHRKPMGIALTEEQTFKSGVELIRLDSTNFDTSSVDLSSDNISLPEGNDTPLTPKIHDSSQIQDRVTSSKVGEEVLSSDLKFLEIDNENVLDAPVLVLDIEAVDGSTLSDKTSQHIYKVKEEASESKVLECVDNEQVFDTPIDANSGCSHDVKEVSNFGPVEINDTGAAAAITDHGDDSFSCVKLDNLGQEVNKELLNLPETGKKGVVSSEGAVDIVDNSTLRVEKPEELLHMPETRKRGVVSSEGAVHVVDDNALRVDKPEKPLDSSKSGEDQSVSDELKVVDDPNNERRVDKLAKYAKPKRRLLPASSSLLRDFNTLDFGDKNENTRGIRGGKKFSNNEPNRTQGNTALLRLLQSNYRV